MQRVNTREEQGVTDFAPVQPYRVANAIVRQVSDMILDGSLAPGARMPAERELARRFMVSRPTLREAVHVLEALGLVEVRPGGGTYVSQKPTALSPRLLEHMMERDDTVSMELIETRREFEIGNAERAAMSATPTDVHGIERCLKAMTRDVETGRDDFKREIDFHLGIAEATHNRVRLFITTSLLLAHLEELRRIRHQMIRRKRQVIEDILREHEAIFAAIKDRNPVKAREAMKAHHDAAYDRMPPPAEWMISRVEAFEPPPPSRGPKPPRRFPERGMRATVKR